MPRTTKTQNNTRPRALEALAALVVLPGKHSRSTSDKGGPEVPTLTIEAVSDIPSSVGSYWP